VALVLSSRERTAATIKYGSDEIACPAGRSLKVETSPAGSELLSEECPAGKAWTVRVHVEIIEVDV